MKLFGVAPVGTCRIHTSLRRGAARHPYQLVLNRNYGFVHTSREVLQQVKLLLGDEPVPQNLWPLIYRPNTPKEFFQQPPVEANLYFFEISSTKHVSIDDVPIQINYVNRYFGDFFADKKLAQQFWSMANSDAIAPRAKWLKDVRQFQRLSAEDRELLSAIKMCELSEADVRQDMAAIIEHVGADKSIFITHVNALTPDDAPIASRQRLIKLVRQLAFDLRVPSYDPTAAMKQLGQLSAMEQDGLDLTHYTLPFADRLAEDWFQNFIKPHAGSQRGVSMDALDLVQAHHAELQEMLRSGRIVEVSRVTREIVRAGQSHHDYRRLLGHIEFELGNFEGAIASLEAVRGTHGAVEEEDVMLMQAHLALGNSKAALSYGRSLISDERETPEILRASAKAAEALGFEEEALTYWKRLLLSGVETATAASAVLAILLRWKEYDAVLEWAGQVLQSMPEHRDSFLAKWRVGLVRGDVGALLELAGSSPPLSNEQVFELAKDTVETGLASPAAALIAPRLSHARPDQNIVGWARQQTNAWREQGLEALEAGELLLASDLIQASVRLAPETGPSIRARRALEQRLRTDIRQAFAGKDHQRVLELTDVALRTAVSFPGLDGFVGRSAAETGNYAKSLQHLRKAVDIEPSAAAMVQLARVAVKAEEYLDALKAYNTILADPGAEEWTRTEAQRAMVKLFTATVRSARKNVSAGRILYAWNLLEQVASNPENRERAKQEQGRIYRKLRSDLKAVDASDTPARLSMAKTILTIAPEDQVSLRIAASAAMRLHQFVEAMSLWQRLEKLAGTSPQLESAIAKCALWISRSQVARAT